MGRIPRTRIAFASGALLATTAHAQGINLSWNDCGTFGQSVETFACDTNVGVHVLVASFQSPVPLPQLVAVQSQIYFQVPGPALPAWWDFTSPTGCRSTFLTQSVDFIEGPYNCVDLWQGQAVGGISFTAGYVLPNCGRIRVAFAVPASTPIQVDNTRQYYAFKILIRNNKTTGAGACDGCSAPACFILDNIQLVQTVGVGDYTLANLLDRQDASWQCPGSVVSEGVLCQTSCPVPARRPSWGGIKSLYK